MKKSEQLQKNRKPNPKKMSTIEYRIYVDFVNDRSSGMCQLGCDRQAKDIHHSQRGINKSDTSIIAVCRECHNKIHSCSYKDIDEMSRLTLLSKKIGKINWAEYIE